MRIDAKWGYGPSTVRHLNFAKGQELYGILYVLSRAKVGQLLPLARTTRILSSRRGGDVDFKERNPNMFCRNCGAEISDKAAVCVKCGVAVAPVAIAPQKTMSTEWLTAVLLCFFLGGFGAHRFYTKDTGIAIVQLVLGLLSCFIVSGIWALIDLIFLLTGNFKTGDGRLLTQY